MHADEGFDRTTRIRPAARVEGTRWIYQGTLVGLDGGGGFGVGFVDEGLSERNKSDQIKDEGPEDTWSLRKYRSWLPSL